MGEGFPNTRTISSTLVSSPPKSEGMGEDGRKKALISSAPTVSSPPKSEGMGEVTSCHGTVLSFLFTGFKPSQIGGDGGRLLALVAVFVVVWGFKPSQIGGDGGSHPQSTWCRLQRGIRNPFQALPNRRGWGKPMLAKPSTCRIAFQALPNRRGWGKTRTAEYALVGGFCFKPSQIGGDGGSFNRWHPVRDPRFVSSPPKSEGMGEVATAFGGYMLMLNGFKPSQIGGDGGRKVVFCFDADYAVQFQALPNRRGWGKTVRSTQTVSNMF